MAPGGSGRRGNTNPSSHRVVASKNWVFTLNNWQEDELNQLLEKTKDGSIKRYTWQEEIGKECGTPHLQGFIEFVNKQRPKEIIKIDRIHWEKCRDINAAINYCSKDDTATGKRWTNIKKDKPLKLIKREQFYDWQKKIIDILDKEPDNRTVNWFWEPTGSVGKTQFCKYICVNYEAVYVSGKSSDVKHFIIECKENNGIYPEIIIIDVPRCSQDYINYEIIEKLKDGIFFSGKYTTGMVIMNSPHIIIFANEEPLSYKLSLDRWNIVKISNNAAGAAEC